MLLPFSIFFYSLQAFSISSPPASSQRASGIWRRTSGTKSSAGMRPSSVLGRDPMISAEVSGMSTYVVRPFFPLCSFPPSPFSFKHAPLESSYNAAWGDLVPLKAILGDLSVATPISTVAASGASSMPSWAGRTLLR